MSTQRRRVLENSGLKDGVYIEGLDGKVYTVDDWQGGNGANSVIVASGDVKFRIALTGQPSRAISRSYIDPLENYMTAISDKTTAKVDYDGAGNTAKILQMQPSTDYAAGYCNAFVFPDGKTKGYLPSLGQLNLAYQNKAAVDSALSKCGGIAMVSDCYYYYWSSTFWGPRSGFDRHCWILRWCDGYVHDAGGSIGDGHYIRPFANLD